MRLLEHVWAGRWELGNLLTPVQCPSLGVKKDEVGSTKTLCARPSDGAQNAREDMRGKRGPE